MNLNKILKRYFLSAYFVLIANFSFAQRYSYPEVGKALPDYTLNDLKNYSKSKLTLSDQKGKWLIVDFWSSVCGGCIKSFPKMNKLAKQFEGKVQIVMIGMTNGSMDEATSEKKTKKLYNMLEKKHSLSFTVAFDSVLHKEYGVKTVPHILIVNPEGIVSNITTGIDETAILDMMRGKSLTLSNALNVTEEIALNQNYNKNIPFLTSGKISNGGNDTAFLFRSLLSKAKRGISPYYKSIPFAMYPIGDKAVFEESMVSVEQLYTLAYIGYQLTLLNIEDERYGEIWPVPLIETNDTTKRKFFTRNRITGEGLFCYSLTVPIERANTSLPINIMKQDLKNYFGLEGIFENRIMPIWKLVVIDSKKVEALRTKSSDKLASLQYGKKHSKFEGIDYIGATMEEVLNVSRSPIQIGGKSENIFINETNIPYRIDIKFKADLTDLVELRAGLQKNGLDLVQGTKEMKVLVLKDSVK